MSFSVAIPKWLWALLVGLALVLAFGVWYAWGQTPEDGRGLAEYGALWWIVKPVVTGRPCPECAGKLGARPNIPEGLTVQ